MASSAAMTPSPVVTALDRTPQCRDAAAVDVPNGQHVAIASMASCVRDYATRSHQESERNDHGLPADGPALTAEQPPFPELDLSEVFLGDDLHVPWSWQNSNEWPNHFEDQLSMVSCPPTRTAEEPICLPFLGGGHPLRQIATAAPTQPTYSCPCGATLQRKSKTRHERTAMHQNYLRQVAPPPPPPSENEAQRVPDLHAELETFLYDMDVAMGVVGVL